MVGEGQVDLVMVNGWITNLELMWEDLGWSAFFRRLASFSRLIVFDKRGTGLSDRVSVRDMPTLEQRMDDVRAVMDAVGSSRAFVLGVSEGGPMSVLFAASYPERTRGLVLYGSFPRITSNEDYPWGFAPEQLEPFVRGEVLIPANSAPGTSQPAAQNALGCVRSSAESGQFGSTAEGAAVGARCRMQPVEEACA